MDEHQFYLDWDAAYLLGSLSRDERLEYEAHRDGCERCQSALGRLASLPGLLGKLDPDEALAILDEGGRPLPLPGAAGRRSRLSVRVVVAGLAAAAVVLLAALVPVLSGQQATSGATNVTLSQTVPSPLSATVRLTRTPWGTRVDMTCTYAMTYGGSDQAYQLYVVDRSGRASLVSSWHAGPGDTARTTGSSDLSPSEISAVQVRDASGAVLLSGQSG